MTTLPPRWPALVLFDVDETLLCTASLLDVRHGRAAVDLMSVPAYAAIQLHEGVAEVIGALSTCFPVGVVSSSPRWYVEQLLTHHLPYVSFAPVVTYDDVTALKPDPEALVTALRLADVEASDAVYVGDALVDLNACAAIGLRFLAAGWAAAEPFPDSTTVLSGPSDLLDALQAGQ